MESRSGEDIKGLKINFSPRYTFMGSNTLLGRDVMIWL
jgi:hypothetical protein